MCIFISTKIFLKIFLCDTWNAGFAGSSYIMLVTSVTVMFLTGRFPGVVTHGLLRRRWWRLRLAIFS